VIDNIHNLIIKYLNKEASFSEIEELENCLSNKKNYSEFKSFVNTNYIITLAMNKNNIGDAKNILNTRIEALEKKIRLRKLKIISLAASICLIFGVSFFSQFNTTKTEIVISKSIEVGSSKAILTLGNGDEIILEKGKKFQNTTVNSNGERLSYSQKNRSNTNNKKSEIVSNLLTIPRGGKFFITLSDGSKVWLNSESKIKYPIKFIEGENREIELLYGEAFFEISRSEKHNGSSFNVITKSQKINVLGTKFNVKAYKDDKYITTTLVEGSVNIQKGILNKILNPSQQAKVSFESNLIETYDIDISQEISWMNNLFTFNESTLEIIMRSLSRWYDVEVVWKSGVQKNFIFTGILERSKSIDDIFSIIEKTSEEELKFEIHGKTIFIK
tara:strand:+ start:4752 stop:5912 length:1161 start_codon:yes stop_codon:yes gene_type:complete